MKKLRKNAGLIFIINLIIFICAVVVAYITLYFNLDNFYIQLNEENLIPKIEVEYLNLDRTELELNIDDINKLTYSSNIAAFNDSLQVFIYDEADENKIVTSFYGDYKLQDKQLDINAIVPISENKLKIDVYTTYDIPDYNSSNIGMINMNCESFSTLLEKIKKENAYIYIPNIDEQLDELKEEEFVLLHNISEEDYYSFFDYNERLKYFEEQTNGDDDTEENFLTNEFCLYEELCYYDYENNDYSSFIYDGLVQIVEIYISDRNDDSYIANGHDLYEYYEYYNDYNDYNEVIINDGLGYEFNMADDKFTIENRNNKKSWEFEVYDVEKLQDEYIQYGFDNDLISKDEIESIGENYGF